MTGPRCCRRSRVSPPLLVGVALWAALAADAGAQGSIATDRAALEALYDATGGPGWTDSTNWKTSAPLAEWFGVTTDPTGRVTLLLFNGNGLAGPIPAALGNLTKLRVLSVQSADLTGPIPAELGGLANLQVLDFEHNDLTGFIPAELGELTNLVRLDIAGNHLTGPVPTWLRNLTELYSLNLGHNDLTGPIPAELSRLVNLEYLLLRGNNDLTGPVPAGLGNLTRLRLLHLAGTGLTGPIPAELGGLTNLETLDLSYSWGLSGPLPSDLQLSPLEKLNIFTTQVCAPAAWRDRLATIEFLGQVCGFETGVTIDVAVFYTPAAREGAGGAAAIAVDIDLRVAETNQANAASGVHHRLRLVERSEVAYNETGNSFVDLVRFAEPSDGHMDEVHAVRDRAGADLVHLIVGHADYSAGRAESGGAFSLSIHASRGGVFAHELGHNMGLRHDRYQDGGVTLDPAYGYVNQPALVAGAAQSRRWRTIMAYPTQCYDSHVNCASLLRFSNPRQHYDGDPLGVPFGSGGSGVSGPADAAGVLNATGPAVALWRDHVARQNRSPVAVGALPDRRLGVGGMADVDVSSAFVDPDIGDVLTYTVSSSAPQVVTARTSGSQVTLMGVGEGAAAIRVTATDPGGLSAWQSFNVTVSRSNQAPEAVGTLPNVQLPDVDATREVDVSGAFTDPDDDALTYTASSSAPQVVTVSAVGSRVTLTAVGEGAAAIRVTATDPGGLSAGQSFNVTVSRSNQAPEAVGTLPNVQLPDVDATREVDVSGAFTDPDDDALTYTASSSAPQVVTVSAVGSRVTLTAVGEGAAAIRVTATDPGGLSAGQSFNVTVSRSNQAPEAVGTLPNVQLPDVDATREVDVSGAFTDPDDDALTYTASSSAPQVVTVSAVGSRVTLTAVGEGAAAIRVTATDPGGLSAGQSFRVLVTAPFTDDPIRPGVTPIKAVHFTELRARINVLRREMGLARFGWTDPVLRAAVTRVRLVHLLELREALTAAYLAAGRSSPRWTDAAPAEGSTPIRAAHLTELRAAVVALE